MQYPDGACYLPACQSEISKVYQLSYQDSDRGLVPGYCILPALHKSTTLAALLLRLGAH